MTGFSVHPETCRRIPLIASSAKHFRYGNVSVAIFSPRRREYTKIFVFRTSATQNTAERLNQLKRLERFETVQVVERLERFERISLFQSGGQFEQQRIVAARGNEREPERTTIQRRQRQ